MNAVLTAPELEELERHRERLQVEVPKPAPRPRAATRRAPREKPFPWAQAALGYALVALIVYLASSLAGQTLTEEARRRATVAEDRSAAARKEVVLLRTQVDRLTDLRAVEQWALQRGFVAAPPTHVAMNEDPIHVASLR